MRQIPYDSASRYNYTKLYGQYQNVINDRSEWETEWRKISMYLLPGRGIFQTHAKPQKRKLTSPKVINTTGEDALTVLTSGMHSRLTSPSMPWFQFAFLDPRLDKIEALKAWLQECEDLTHEALHASNFYSIINSFYTEYAGFGTGCVYTGEDVAKDVAPFRFELLTAGEYSFVMGPDGLPAMFFRTIAMSPYNLVERFGKDFVAPATAKKVKENDPDIHTPSVSVLEILTRQKYGNKPFTQLYYEIDGAAPVYPQVSSTDKQPLEVNGFHEHPYAIARWSTIGADNYGIGPGARALPDIMRLQEMEKAFLMATHKTINPPLSIPARMKGKTNTLPGGENFHQNPMDKIESLYNVNFDYNGVGGAVERVEQRIQRNFYNDVFLTASRDPNASPLKARQVDAIDMEEMLRLGPVVERLGHEFFQPILQRVFKSMRRRDLYPPLDPELEALAGQFEIRLVSPLATAQRAAALQGLSSFLGFVGQAAQFDQSVLDNVNTDEAAREYANITGVRIGILRPKEDVAALREQRAKQAAAQQKKQDDLVQAGAEAELDGARATAQKAQSEAGLNYLEGQKIQQNNGMM